MKKLLVFILFIFLTIQNVSFADVVLYSEGKKFGAKDETGNIVIKPVYNKIIRLGDTSFLVQKKTKFGIIDKDGNVLVSIKYRHAERVLGKYAKLGNYADFGLYDENGFALIPPIYDSVDLLFGGMFLTYKNYKYGVSDSNGKVLLDNLFDDIYMPKPNIMRLQYKGEWYEIEQVTSDTLHLPDDVRTVKENKNFKVTNLVYNTGAVSGYSVVTFSDYLIKILSSVSPAHEETIDQLMLSQGAETVSILIKLTWLPKYPFYYARNYYRYLRNPNNGLFYNLRNRLKNKIK